MSDSTGYVTIFRSAEETAEVDAWGVAELLCGQGFHAEAVGDKTPGVVEGSWEVRVPAAEGPEAEKAAENISFHDFDEDALDEDPSHDMDLVTVAHTDGTTGEMEATNIRAMLDASGIYSIVVGDSILPNLGFEVRVPAEDRAKAEATIAEARAAGPAAAAQGEAESEKQQAD